MRKLILFLVLFILYQSSYSMFINPGFKIGYEFGNHSFIFGAELSGGYIDYNNDNIPFLGGVMGLYYSVKKGPGFYLEAEAGGTLQLVTPGLAIGYDVAQKFTYLRPFVGFWGSYLSIKYPFTTSQKEIDYIEKPVLKIISMSLRQNYN
jgi:hypothetical protein